MKAARCRAGLRARTALLSAVVLGLLSTVGAAHAQGPPQPRGAPPSVATDPSERSIVLRPARIDLVVGARTVRSVVREPGPVSLAAVAGLVANPRWLSAEGGVVTLRVGFQQAPDTHLFVEAPEVTTLRLARAAAGSSWMKGSRATLSLRGLQITGWDSDLAAPAAPGPDRPFIAYGAGATVEVQRSSFTGLGRSAEPATGVSFSRSRVSVTNSSFDGNAVGLAVSRPSELKLENVSVSRSAASGLVVEEPNGGIMRGVTSESNGGNGVEVTHLGRGLQLASVKVTGNVRAGVLLDSQSDLTASDITSSGNGGAGVQVKSGRAVALSALSSTGDGVGLALSDKTAGAVVDGAELQGSATGVSLSPETSGVQLSRVSATDIAGTAFDLAGTGHVLADSSAVNATTGVGLDDLAKGITVRGVALTRVASGLIAKRRVEALTVQRLDVTEADVGLALAGSRINVREGTLAQVKTGVRIYGAASDVSLDGTIIVDSGVGVLATSGTRDLRLTDVIVDQDTGIGISTSSADLHVAGGVLTGSLIGIDVHGTVATVEGTTIRAREGIRLGRESRLALSGVRVDAVVTAVKAGPATYTEVRSSRLWGTVASEGPGRVEFRGENDLPPTPLPWYGVAALVATVSAVVLEVLRRMRETESAWATPVAAHVLNRA